MASRQLRRLQQQAQPGIDDPKEEEDEDSPPAQAKPSLFSLLGEDAPSEASEEDAEQTTAQDEPNAPPEAAKSEKRGKSAKRKQKKKGKKVVDQPQAKHADDADGDLDKILEELNIKVDAAALERMQGEASTSGSASVLSVNPKRLKPEDELRRIFGSKIVDMESRQDDASAHIPGAGRRVRRLMARGLIQRVQLKPGLIIQPKDHWPKPDGAITMECLEDRGDGHRLFSYVYSPAYQAVQEVFARVQETYDPNELLDFVNVYHSHVDGLLAASELYRGTNQNDAADDLLERALYVLEMAWHPRCNPISHRACRLALSRRENQAFFTALFRYVQMLTKRGLYATALENAKLLVQLQGGDAIGVMMCIDYIALKAGQYDFLEALVAEIDPSGDKFAFQPNLTYSLALAAYLKAAQAGAVPDEVLQRGVRAVMQYPNVVPLLIDWLQEKGVHPDAEFKSALQSELFASASERSESASLAHLTDIYVERSASLFKEKEAFRWLKLSCMAAAAPGAESARRNWAFARTELFPPSQEDKYSHLRLSMFTDDVSRLPDEIIQAMRAANNPLGGVAPEVRQELAEVAAMPEIHDIAERLHHRQPVSEEELQQLNPFIALVRSLLPWVDLGDGQQGLEAGHRDQAPPRDPTEDPPAPDAGNGGNHGT